MESVLTIGLNPAFERVYIFPSFKEGEVNRAEKKYVFASGKGINTSRALNILGRTNTNITHLGGNKREEFLSLVREENIKVEWVDSSSEIRTCTTLINKKKGTSTELVEESSPVSGGTSLLIYNLFQNKVLDYEAVIISGSKAGGHEEWLIPAIVKECEKNGIKAVLDIKGEDLLSSLKYRPYLVKINLSELATTFNLGAVEENEDNGEIKKKALSIMKELYGTYGTMTLISRGKFPSIYYDGKEEGEIECERVKAVNTIGCGDTLTAAVTHYLLLGKSLKEAAKEDACRRIGCKKRDIQLQAMKEIYLIRHGRQDIKAFNEDVPLSERGIKQALLLKDRLKDEKYDKIYSSTLKRAVETADIINENWHLDIERRKELGEIDYGDLTSLPLEAKTGEYKAFFSELEKRKSDLPFPGGENSSDVWKRAQVVFKEIELSPYSRILIVCHGGMIRATLLGLLSLPMTKRLVFSKHLENTSITKLLYDEKSNLYYLETLNDHAHLGGHSELLREF